MSKDDTIKIEKKGETIPGIKKLIDNPEGKKTWQEKSRSEDAISKGDLKIKEYRKYYDINSTITTAQASNPNDPDHVNYNRERVYEFIERHAEKVTVSNDGGDTLFVIISHSGENFSRERPIYPGERKVYYNVYELRMRSPTAGISYRTTEYDIQTSNAVVPNRVAFTTLSAQNIASGLPATQLNNVTVPNGFALVVRANPNNNADVYLADSSANTNVAASRITLSPGDSVLLYITNANLVFVLGAAANQDVDYWVEQ